MGILLRKALEQDLPAVHALVQQLAEYERAPAEVTTTAELYIADFRSGKFDAIIAEENGELVGMALYYIAYSTWKGNYLWLEDFIVDERYRGKGIGTLIFDAIRETAKSYNTFFKWQVLDWNEPAVRFYEKYGMEVQEEWMTCKLGG